MHQSIEHMLGRQANAAERFLDYVQATANIDRARALRILAFYRKNRLVQLGANDGQFRVKHGALLDADVLLRAANAS